MFLSICPVSRTTFSPLVNKQYQHVTAAPSMLHAWVFSRRSLRSPFSSSMTYLTRIYTWNFNVQKTQKMNETPDSNQRKANNMDRLFLGRNVYQTHTPHFSRRCQEIQAPNIGINRIDERTSVRLL